MVEPTAWLDRHRTYVMVTLMLVAVAVVGLATGGLVGLAGGGQEPRARRTTTPQAALAATPSASPEHSRQPADSEVEPGRRNDVGYFLAASQEGDGVHVTFDRVQVLAGAAAIAYARKQNQPPPPGGILVVNENPRTRELVLSPDVEISGGTQLAGSAGLQEISVQTLLEALSDKGRTTVLDISYDDLGYVTEVTEKQLP